MNILMISGDKHLLEEGSDAYNRLQLQRGQVERLDVFVWPQVNSPREISATAKRTKYDVVTAQDPFWRGLLAWRVAKRTRAKLNLQVHTDLSAQPLLRRMLARFLLHRADSVRVVSEDIRSQVHTLGVQAPIHVLPIFIDALRFSSVVPRPHAGKNILWIGRFEEEKNPLRAIEVLKEVLKEVPDAKLTMIGSGTLGSRISERAANLPVEVSLGWQNPLVYLDIADVVLCTSWHESFGASIVEALAAGVSVVAPDIGIAREAGAIIVPRGELAQAVIEVLRAGARGKLKLSLPSAEEWAREWKATLI